LSYLLDTNACIALLNGAPASVGDRFERAVAGGESVAIPSVVAFELWYGAAKSARRKFNTERLKAFFASPVPLLSFDQEDARAAGELRARLEARGGPIGPYDLLIAGAALARGLTLVTANLREFSRVPGLAWEDWGRG
jgi:tRNA(fMet)-specific endonuclease VapC